MEVMVSLVLMNVILILYPYLIYPSLVGLIYYLRKPKVCASQNDQLQPFLSCIIAVYNEEAVIHEKIVTLLKSHFPKNQMKIYIGSDGSTDRSNEILHKIAQTDHRIVLKIFPERAGKASVINALTSLALTEHVSPSDHILVYTDANIYLKPSTLEELVKGFSDARIAVIDSRILQRSSNVYGVAGTEKNYIQLESRLKFMEGYLWGVSMGAFGGCYAVRASYACQLPPGLLVDDFYITMQAMIKGGLSITQPMAICYEDIPDNILEEFKRKKRIAAGNFQNMRMFLPKIFEMNFHLAFAFISHKVMRWLVPFWGLILLMLIAIGVIKQMAVFEWVACVMTIMILIFPGVDWLLGLINIKVQCLRSWRYFLLMNLAVLMGLLRYLQGIQKGTWQPPKRIQTH